MVVTEEWLMANRTKAGSWRRSQLEILGISWPAKKGWIKRVEGLVISDEKGIQFETFALSPKKSSRKNINTQHSVYFIRAGSNGPIKIGMAKDVNKRLSTLQTGNHEFLMLLATIPCKSLKEAEYMERKMHRCFKKQHIRGEWYKGSISIKDIEAAEFDNSEREKKAEQMHHDLKLLAGYLTR